MSYMFRLGIGVIVAVFLAAPPVLTHSMRAPQLTPSDGSPATYLPCPDPAIFCPLFHGPTAEFVGGCDASGYYAPSCFEMSYAEAARVVAADEQGDFPTTLFVWPEAEMVPWGSACTLTHSGKKTRLELRVGYTRCAASLVVGDYVYYEHFASNPESGRVCWGECRVPVLVTH